MVVLLLKLGVGSGGGTVNRLQPILVAGHVFPRMIALTDRGIVARLSTLGWRQIIRLGGLAPLQRCCKRNTAVEARALGHQRTTRSS
jgi:hypothetical protein